MEQSEVIRLNGIEQHKHETSVFDEWKPECCCLSKAPSLNLGLEVEVPFLEIVDPRVHSCFPEILPITRLQKGDDGRGVGDIRVCFLNKLL